MQASYLTRLVLDLNETITLHKKPNGTREFPASSCCDLKENYPEVKTGM